MVSILYKQTPFDLYSNIEDSIELTYSNWTVSALNNRYSDYSNSFKIPKTSNNMQILIDYYGEYASIEGVSIDIFNRLMNVDFLVKGFNAVQDASLKVISITESDIEIQIISGLTTIMDNFDESIRTTDGLGSYAVTVQNVVDSYNWNKDNSNYYLPLIELSNNVEVNDIPWYVLASNKIVDVRYILPCAYESNIVNAIFENEGYKIEGDVLNDDIVKHSSVACSGTYRPETDKDMTPYTKNGLCNFYPYWEHSWSGGGSGWFDVDCWNQGGFNDNLSYIVSGLDTGSSIFVDVYAKIYVNWTNFGVADDAVEFNMLINEEEFEPFTYYNNNASGSDGDMFERAANIRLKNGDTLKWVARGSKGGIMTSSIIVTGQSTPAARSIWTFAPTKINLPIIGELKDILPDIPKRDFIGNFIKRFALMAQINQNTKTVLFSRIKDIYAKKANGIYNDLSNQFLNKYTISTNIDNLYKKGWLKYNNDTIAEDDPGTAEDESAINDEYGNEYISIDFASQKEGDIVSLNASASYYINSFGNSGYITSFIPNIDALANGDPAWNEDITMRYLTDVKEEALFSITITDIVLDTPQQVINRVCIPNFAHTTDNKDLDERIDDIYLPSQSFKYLAQEYYPMLNNINKLTQEVECEMYLPMEEMYNLDLSIPVYDSGTCQYYIIKEVGNYKINGSCNIKLIKM